MDQSPSLRPNHLTGFWEKTGDGNAGYAHFLESAKNKNGIINTYIYNVAASEVSAISAFYIYVL